MSVFAHLRRLNPVIKGEDSGATAIWDANRYNERGEVIHMGRHDA